MNKTILISLILTTIPSLVCPASEPIVKDLWKEALPGTASRVEGPERNLTKLEDKLIAGRPIIKLGHVSTPQMHVFLPSNEKINGGAVLVCPGGGFNILAWDLEGTEVAEWLNSLGFAAVVVKYRVPTREHGDSLNQVSNMPGNLEGPVMDAQRAMSITRSHAAEWQIDPNRIGIIGFSAGGATAGMVALRGEQRAYPKIDDLDEASCEANFAMLIYPGGFLDKTTGGLRDFVKPSRKTPPTFLAMAQDDNVPVGNCIELFSALKKAKVPVEAHLYARGGHGYGLRTTFTPVTSWALRAEEWLRASGFASSPPSLAKRDTIAAGHPADHLPQNIRRITKFGERAEFSRDGRHVLFLSKQFGDVMEYDIATGSIECLSQHFKHYGFNRALYLANGDILLTGPTRTFDVTDKASRLNARDSTVMSILDRSLTRPPTALNTVAVEGPAVSRSRLQVAWTHHIERESRQSVISMGEIVYDKGVPSLANVRLVLTTKDFPEGMRPKMIETQNFVRPDDKQLTITAYLIENGHNTDGYLFDPETMKLTNFTNTPDHYEEVEGVFPDGKSTLVERNSSVGKPWPLVDAWQVWFDRHREPRRLTRFLDFQGYKASNYVVSDDGQLMAFQLGVTGDEAGVGYGLFLMELNEEDKAQ